MKFQNFAKVSIFSALLMSALVAGGCQKQELVSFGQYGGTYDGKPYSVAASTWEKQEDEEGFEEVWKLVGVVKYDENTGKTLYYGDADTQHYVAITVKAEKSVKPESATYKVDNRILRPFDNGNKNTFTLIKAISSSSKDFTLTVNWNTETHLKYKFVIDQEAFTLEENHV